MSSSREREIISELIESYRDLPCVWDLSSESFRDARQKKTAWEILLQKFKEFDPNANEASVRKKMDTLKCSFNREAKKVKESKNRTGSAASDIHKPNLWYYEQMTFLEKKTEANRSGVDTLMVEDEDDPPPEESRKTKLSRDRILEKKKLKLIDSAQNLMEEKNKDVNSFGIYVGQKLDQIQGDQREIAEKLISEVIFLAKINNLSLESKIYTPPKAKTYADSEHNFTPDQFTHSTSSHQIQSFPSSYVPLDPHSISTQIPQSSATHCPQPFQSPTSSYSPRPSSTLQSYSPANHSPQPVQSPHRPSSTLQSYSPANESPQPVQSSHRPSYTLKSYTPANHSPTPVQSTRRPSYTLLSYSPANHSLQPVQSPHRPSYTLQSYPPANNSPQPVQSPPHNPHSPTDHTDAQMYNTLSLPLTQSSQAFENVTFIEGPAENSLKEMLIFKK